MTAVTPPPIILASGSPRRKALLARLGLPYTLVTSGVDEHIDPSLDPAALVRELARQKAQVVAATCDEGLIIGADTAVVLGETILGKPVDAADAARMLRLLCSRTHRVISGVAVIDARTSQAAVTSVTTLVRMNSYDEAQITAYVASGEPMDKAGSYAIQGLGGALVAGIEGCYNNVVGFPLCEVAALLTQFGVIIESADPVCVLADGAPCPRLLPTPGRGGAADA